MGLNASLVNLRCHDVDGRNPRRPVHVTEQAARRIRAIAAGEPPGSRLRVSVSGGGCSGFQYEFGFDTQVQPDDLVITRDGVEVLVDPVSLPSSKAPRSTSSMT